MARAAPVVLAGFVLGLCPCIFALNPELDVSQYAHFSWKYRDGFAKSEILEIVQTPDGYLWLTTQSGLLRFDGVQPVPWQPPPDPSGKAQPLPSNPLTRLLAARDGTLWIGSRHGLASWKDGKLRHYAEFAGLSISRLIEDREGSIWVGAYDLPNGKLCEIEKGSVRCDPEFRDTPFGLHEDQKGNLWVGSGKGLWRWKPGPPKFYDLPTPNVIQGIVDGEDGGVLVSTTDGIRRLVDGKWELLYPLPASLRGQARSMIRDRDGAVWVRTHGGIVHVHQGRTDVFSQVNGLTGDEVSSLFEDREGNVWVATANGLDRFGELAVITYSADQGVRGGSSAVMAAKDGSVWFITATGLNRLNHGELTVYSQLHSSDRARMRAIRGSGVPDQGLASLFQDSRGRIWICAINEGLGYLQNDRFIRSAAPPGAVNTFTEDSAGNLWIPYPDRGLVMLSPDDNVQQLPWDTFGHNGPGIVLPDRVNDGLWLGFRKGGVGYFLNGRVRASYSAAEGLAAGQVNQLRFDRQGALWISTDGGLGRLKDGHVATLTSKDGLPCDAVLWSMDDDAQSVWLGMPCGVVRVARSELDAWVRKQPRVTIHPTVFDTSDGARMFGAFGGWGPHVDKSPDGKLWFGTPEGLSFVDPRHIPFNKLPPPVQIEQLTANRKTYGAEAKLRLPPLVRDLQIDYTALSLVAPEKNRFRYRLEGHDIEWTDAGNRRQAFYNDLAPRKYRFRVQASNNDGVWNEAGASLDFSIDPAYYQTLWFQTLCTAAFLALLWGLYQFRLFQIAQQYNMRLEERVGERTRIARDLHDTLLQSFQGLLFELQAARNLFQRRPEDAMRTLDDAIGSAEVAIVEGRDAIQNLRAGSGVRADLARLLTAVGKELSEAANSNGNIAAFGLTVEGPPQPLSPVVQDELYRMGREILRNAFRHARAKKIEVEIRYDDRMLRLRIRDDGIGIDPKVLGEGLRPGHWGLPGVRERAKLLGAKLDFWSEARAGTEVQVAVPAAAAYAKSPDARVLGLFGKTKRSHAE